jgi:hypothetical protein
MILCVLPYQSVESSLRLSEMIFFDEDYFGAVILRSLPTFTDTYTPES